AMLMAEFALRRRRIRILGPDPYESRPSRTLRFLKISLGRVRAVVIFCECPILFLALDCLVQRSPAGGETKLQRALTNCQ
ncbi:MAG: hypothetical protein IJ334_09805, partial [Clostridia bacterium]|nr:hypothetical protein [Clostridia bacterium]